MKNIFLISVAASTWLFSATDDNIQDLQKRVEVLEKTLQAQQTDKIKQALNSKNNFNHKGFMPDISLILNGSLLSRDIKNSLYEGYAIQGFNPQTEEISFNKNRGFNLNYAEFGMHSVVGPYFDADAIFHIHPDGLEMEEAYITTKKLPSNLQIKAGLFRSGFGRINAIHHHAQHFLDTPLVYEALLGNEGIKDAGISVNWVFPTDTYITLAVEALQGSNELSFGYEDSNNLYVTYLKSGFDIGKSNTLLVGGSMASGKTKNNKDSKLYGFELTLKHMIDSYSSLTWQSEYLYRDREKQKQAGVYSQLLYELNSNWELGTRYDAITKNLDTQPDDLKKYSAILSYKPFEFSKLRLQYTKDKSKSFAGKRQDIDIVALDFLVEIGAHRAHAF